MITVDRIEGTMAVVDVGGHRISLPVAELPPGTKEGDVLRIERASPDNEEANQRLERLKATTPQGPGTFEL
jgi:hypothetical protein